ncbi:60S ribosomal protein L12 [Prunus yedoensis var. nudiflora]|uniref:60S ribosomal protein L12 n=1 Tax=Prunus yedoensis var. nudiflora TaxID=2094558 RepID=A0A314YI75_PRUYE|nr:60S ribosomal protein L12 [Prunus yedoensis var. nudiflora]
MAKELAGMVKEILGTCVSVGCTVDGKDPKDLQQEIADGDVEIPLDWAVAATPTACCFPFEFKELKKVN